MEKNLIYLSLLKEKEGSHKGGYVPFKKEIHFYPNQMELFYYWDNQN